METGLDGEIHITILRRTFDGEPTHWEVEAWAESKHIDGWIEGTAPTFLGAVDMAFEYIADIDKNRWTQFDSNARNDE